MPPLPHDLADRLTRAVAVGLTLLVALPIAVFALGPVPEAPGLPTSDKTQHLLAFATLVAPSAILAPRLLIWTVPFALVYGGAIELVQPHVGRQGELADWLADLVGVALGAGLGWAAGALWRSGKSGASR